MGNCFSDLKYEKEFSINKDAQELRNKFEIEFVGGNITRDDTIEYIVSK